MKRLAMSVLMSAMSTGAFASVPQATNTLLVDFGTVCEQKLQGAQGYCVSDIVSQGNKVVELLEHHTATFRTAFYDIADMENPEDAFDISLEEMDALEMLVRGIEGFGKGQRNRLAKACDCREAEEVLAATDNVLFALSNLRAVIYDLNGLARQCMSDEFDLDCEFEPNDEFFTAMHEATETALTVH